MSYKETSQQVPEEHAKFCELIAKVNAKSYLEIGSHAGGSLWRVAHAMPPGSKIVSVDLPHPHIKPSLEDCIAELKKTGYDARVIFGDSRRHDIVFDAAKDAPYDVVFIDANHTEPFVRLDYKNYGQMAKKILAFHDVAAISRRPNRHPIEVKTVWDEIKKDNLNTEEIIADPNSGFNGIGIVWVDE